MTRTEQSNVAMASIDYTAASISVREAFSFTKSALEKAYSELKNNPYIIGSVIISTCNRTEIYISYKSGANITPFGILCELAGKNYAEYKHIGKSIYGKDVLFYLCELASGVKSQIWGEDQILGQVKDAISESRDLKACDAALEVMFRTAVTCAKKVKTAVKFGDGIENSIVGKMLNILNEFDVHDPIKKVMVIGSGKIGREIAKELVARGYKTVMTVRSYRKTESAAVEGTETIDYAERYGEIAVCDAVVSATLSPHYTITLNEFKKCPKCPRVLIDIAVPRDIEPEIASCGVSLYDVDSICAEELKMSHANQLLQVHQVIEKYMGEYSLWQARRLMYA